MWSTVLPWSILLLCLVSRFDSVPAELTVQPTDLEKILEHFPIFDHPIYAALSDECRTSTISFFENVRNRQLWALQMADAWGKLPSGIVRGDIYDLGDYDECRNVILHDDFNFNGLYCLSHYREPGDTYSFVLGVCFPNTCNNSEVASLFNALFDNVNVTATVPADSCSYTGETHSFSNGTVAMIVVLTVIFTWAFLGTLADVYFRHFAQSAPSKKGVPHKLLLSFSLYTNTQKLLSTDNMDGSITCVFGLRFLSMAWVILGHTWYMATLFPFENYLDMENIFITQWPIQIIGNATLSVDTFFAMSGLLAAFLMLKQIDKAKGRINILYLYIHRYLRLTPTYMLIVGIIATVLPHMGDGPYWWKMQSQADECVDNWWVNILYINNFKAIHPSCAGESWYLANDMQFYIVTPLVLYPVWRWPKFGLSLLSLITLGSVLTPALLTYYEDYLPTIILTKSLNGFYSDVYVKPYTRAGPYVVGIWAGYILYRLHKHDIKFNKWFVVCGWCVSTASALAVLFGIYNEYNPDYEMSNLSRSLYGGLNRFVWGICICWVITACIKGYGGPVNALLSWKFFIPLGRLTYCAYLLSFMAQISFHASLRQVVYYNWYYMVNIYFAHLCMSLFWSFIATLLLESPFISIEKLIFPRPTARRPSRQQRISMVVSNEELIVNGVKVTNGRTEGNDNPVFMQEEPHPFDVNDNTAKTAL